MEAQLVGQKLSFLTLLHLVPVTSSGKKSWNETMFMHRRLLDSGGRIMLHFQCSERELKAHHS